MIQVQSNKSVRNVAENALVDLQLLRSSVFFGVNGSGKSTVCEVLSQASTLRDSQRDSEATLHVFAYDDKWRKDKVGDFIEGGSAKGVVTVKLNNDAGDLEKKIRNAQKEWESAKASLREKHLIQQSVATQQEQIVEKVAKGTRKTLEPGCPSLTGNRFRRPDIRALLEDGGSTILSQSEVEERIIVANSTAPGFLPPLADLPTVWSFSNLLWNELNEKTSAGQTVALAINDWVRDGLELHKAGESCQFCNGTVTAKRITALEDAILQAEKVASSLVKEELGKCRTAVSALESFKNKLETTDFSSSIYGEDLQPKKAETLLETTSLIEQLEAATTLLKEQVKNPGHSVQGEKPQIDSFELKEKYGSLKKSHLDASQQIANHSQNQKSAISQLKRHCCASDGAEWSSTAVALEKAQKETQRATRTEASAKEHLDNLKLQVSTTADTATFLDDSLGLILGERTLRVSEGGQGEGYRITRHDQKANSMSEGEKKLVSLLYFCAEFLSEERKQLVKDSVVMFDDLGSELDEPRLLAIDRFISKQFHNPAPAALVYFTHSHTYLKILQSRLAAKAVAPKHKNQEFSPKAIFYEVYKDSFSPQKQTTRCRQWDDEAIRLTSDYWLSFYMVLRAFEDLQEDSVPSLGTGNFCRKVLEGFTEFRVPNDDKFGSRIDTLLSQKDLPLSPALSKVVNGLSHSDLSKNGGVLSRNEVEHAVVQTLVLMKMVDEEHFTALLNKFRSKKASQNIEKALVQRAGIEQATA